MAPFADMLYAADAPWWNRHEGVPGFAGAKWTQDQHSKTDAQYVAAQRWGLRMVRSETKAGLSRDPWVVHQGFNSGYQALNWIVLAGASTVLLLGFDCKSSQRGQHWFGEHDGALSKACPFDKWLLAFASAVPDLKELGVNVINCSRDTALTCFPRAKLEDVLP